MSCNRATMFLSHKLLIQNLVLICIRSVSFTSGNSEGTVRLFRNGIPDTAQSWSSGIVQIYYNSQWGNICDGSGFGSDEADVICHQLGYTGASSYSNTGVISTFGVDFSSTVINDVSCSTSLYLTITQCSLFTISSCNSADVIVSCHSTRIWDSPSPGDIHLTGGTYSNQGLLEVYCNGEWGTVCDDDFTSTEAIIACRQLGYNYYRSYDHLSFQTNPSQPIWLNTVDSCSSSTDTCLTSCGSCPSSALTICTHSVTLECRYHSFYQKVTHATKSANCYDTDTTPIGTVRLFRNGVPDTNQSWSSGIVQIYYNSTWGNICDDSSFGSDEADVICHQLGYTGASSYSNTGNTSKWGTDTTSTVMDDVSCLSSSYLTITQCTFSTNISCSCNNTNDVIVACYSTRVWDSPSPGDIRLTGGKYSNEGLLEVYCNSLWGTVCDHHFFETQATVACRQLGYNSYKNYDNLSLRGSSSQSIWLKFLSSCSSSDSLLVNCGSCSSSSIIFCSHSEDITLVCEYTSPQASSTGVYYENSSNCDIISSIATTNATSTTSSNTGVIVGSLVGSIVCVLLVIVLSVHIYLIRRKAASVQQRAAPPRPAPPACTTATTDPVTVTVTITATVAAGASGNAVTTATVQSIVPANSVESVGSSDTKLPTPSTIVTTPNPGYLSPDNKSSTLDTLPSYAYSYTDGLSTSLNPAYKVSVSTQNSLSPSKSSPQFNNSDNSYIYNDELPTSPNAAYRVPNVQLQNTPSSASLADGFEYGSVRVSPSSCHN